jgi:hypothetical protein
MVQAQHVAQYSSDSENSNDIELDSSNNKDKIKRISEKLHL